ncbi:MAG TPA: valine--tRNA ligase [Candidatus Scatosoma pullicola]|nr:valine--tRNA ligase [Candidatus Scatosoma pullicola]
MEMQKTYNPGDFEDRIYAGWENAGCFRAEIDKDKVPFTIMMPPPNITGQLHMGHAMDAAMQDTLIRFKRMQGYAALWLPGYDHASIATEVKIVEKLREEGESKQSLGREGFLKRAWEWTEKYGGRITLQQRKLGASCDWSRQAFTMDERCSRAVREAFVNLYKKGLIYRGNRIINWCTQCRTALSDAEVEYAEEAGHFWHIRYPFADGQGEVIVATTRPETMLGDTAVAVNPADERYKALVGKTLRLPLTDREIPVVADEYVDMEFGTGCVKITPAHDPNDFEVGKRHDLPVIRVMNDDGTMNEQAGRYAGQDRYAARKNIVADLEAGGYLVKVEPHVHNVGHCYRCHTTVEPIVSRQWFVKMEPLAKPAIAAVMKNKVKFIPERFTKVYYNWMENVRDWCISRQLWWGHRIPVWYCDDCGATVCEKEDPAVCPVCGGAHLRQDEDVLDTWFSSALWPFSTLGFPEKTADYEYFYPTDVLVTGYDIIFFWVARMIFSGIEHTGKVPFRDVLIHGLVRDEQGRKMSKSLGNGVDPLEVVQKYGADSLRLSLLTGVGAGNDTRYSDTKVESCRNFINKLWNASRFVLMNAEGKTIVPVESVRFSPADKWIISRLQNCIREVTTNLNKYELGVAADLITDFVWGDFCDWYIELSKPALYGEDEEKKSGALSVLCFVLENALKLLHPFVPFVTEEIWHNLPGKSEKDILMLASFPRYNSKLSYKKEAKSFEGVMEIIKAVRAMKKAADCPPSRKVEVYLVTESKRLVQLNKDSIMKLSGASAVKFAESGAAVEGKTVSQATEIAQIYIPLGELVDIEKEKARLAAEIERVNGEIARAEGKLANAAFVAKAPKKLVDGEREKLEKYRDMKAKFEEQLAGL